MTTFDRALDRDNKLMAVLGSRLLEPQKKVAESAEALKLRQMTKGSLLAEITKSINQSLTRWIQWTQSDCFAIETSRRHRGKAR